MNSPLTPERQIIHQMQISIDRLKVDNLKWSQKIEKVTDQMTLLASHTEGLLEEIRQHGECNRLLASDIVTLEEMNDELGFVCEDLELRLVSLQISVFEPHHN